MTVAGWPVDGHSGVHEPLAQRVDIVDAIGEVAEIAVSGITALVPIVGQLDFSFVPGNSEEDQGETALRHVLAPPFLEPQQAEKANCLRRIGYPQHRMEKAH